MEARNIDAEKINVDLLPKSLRDLAAVIGIGAALKVAAEYPGLCLYIPARAQPTHKLVPLIGLEKLAELCAVYRGEEIEVPKLDKALMQIRHQLLRDMQARQCSNREIARALNYTERRVRQLKSELEQDAAPDLFDPSNNH